MKIDTDWFNREIAKSAYRSQRQIAKHLGFTQGNFSRVISGQQKMDLQTAQRLAVIFGCPPAVVIEHLGVDMSDVHDLLSALEHYAKGSDGKKAAAVLKKWKRSTSV